MTYTLWNGFSVFPWNIPLERPGAYRLHYLNDGRNYIGITTNVGKRGYEHSTTSGHVEQLDKFLKENSLGKKKVDRHKHFLFEPLYYAISPNETRKGGKLHDIEQSLILIYDSINYGWNLPHPNVAELCKNAESISRRKNTESSLETKLRRKKALENRWEKVAITYTYNGETKTLKEWAKIYNAPYETLHWRFKHGKEVLPW